MIITFLVGNPYKPSFATVTGRGATLLISSSPIGGDVKYVLFFQRYLVKI